MIFALVVLVALLLGAFFYGLADIFEAYGRWLLLFTGTIGVAIWMTWGMAKARTTRAAILAELERTPKGWLVLSAVLLFIVTAVHGTQLWVERHWWEIQMACVMVLVVMVIAAMTYLSSQQRTSGAVRSQAPGEESQDGEDNDVDDEEEDVCPKCGTVNPFRCSMPFCTRCVSCEGATSPRWCTPCNDDWLDTDYFDGNLD